MAQVSSEFIFFKVKCDVEPEDPANELGEGLMRVFRATKHQSGHHSSAWGRTVEDPNMLVWVIEWTDARCAITSCLLKPFLVEEDQPITAIYATLSPPIGSTETLTKNPVTELCFLAFPNNMSACETRQLDAELINFRTALVVQLPQEMGPRSWSMGHVDRPSTVKHGTSPNGLATVHLLAVGWETMEAHDDAKKTKEFVDAIAPIREKLLLPPVPDMEVKHVRFQKL
ncbi:uncharacterized protein N7496_003143 [Penicillium cataractarum]|uniref:ABM domain-containing protein n=1 Tax=Penicillium cataractarum TaxID=2100454 RepID=A0A9W9SMI6_9EURO|nr:uncharacterized protein N7496_003143 [Penicillium cataractarum]KAJ5380715.1 hypothetical protein N7496_003143 [Penicillium cataractarum]